MEPQFVNQYHLTLEMYKDWAAHPVGAMAIKNRKKGIALRVALICCSVVLILCGFFLQDYIFIIMGGMFLCLGILRLKFIPDRVIKKQYDLMLKVQNRTEYIRTITFAEDITSEDGNTTTRYSYAEVTKVSEDINYFYLFLGPDIVLRVHKASFIVGNVDTFRAFCQMFPKEA